MTDQPHGLPSLSEAFVVWCRIAALSFGGPAGQIAVMHRILVDEKRWIGEDRFVHALSYCMLLPGPEAQQLATYIGWLMHRLRGGLMAGILFVLPGYVAIMALSILYAMYRDVSLVSAIFFGLKPAVMAIVVEAVIRIGRRILKNCVMFVLAAVSFVLIFFCGVPFPAIIAGAALVGLIGERFAPRWFVIAYKPKAAAKTATEQVLLAELEFAALPQPTQRRAVIVSVVCLSLWFVPLVIVAKMFGQRSVFVDEGLFFSQAAVVTFGGAYAVLAYIQQQAVEQFHWLAPGEMLDGLGLAETTPGPLIMVVQFVGFLGAYRNPGSLSPLVAGVLGATLTTWVTFVPCFYWIFLGAPYVEKLRGSSRLNAMLSSITAAVVGVVLNMAVWFAVHVIFGIVETHRAGILRVLSPVWSTFDVAAAAIGVVAMVLTFVLQRGVAFTLTVCCGLGIAAKLALPG